MASLRVWAVSAHWEEKMFQVLVLLTALSQLDHKNFSAREAAERQLSPLPGELVAAVEHAEKYGKTAEMRKRAERLLNRYYQTHADRLSKLVKDVPPIQFVPVESLRWSLGETAVLYWWIELHEAAQKSLNPRLEWVMALRFDWDGHRYWPECSIAVQIEMTRLLVRDRIAARLPVLPLLEQLRIERERERQKKERENQ